MKKFLEEYFYPLEHFFKERIAFYPEIKLNIFGMFCSIQSLSLTKIIKRSEKKLKIQRCPKFPSFYSFWILQLISEFFFAKLSMETLTIIKPLTEPNEKECLRKIRVSDSHSSFHFCVDALLLPFLTAIFTIIYPEALQYFL